ncbi:prostatic acid phosphatase-like isoform X1 [Palaemon carinicauda]|uniref:prostatic acid phosphatase-like isoform X1 n=1 Tax=Palaemon carinicauda TaxID=392227 RepID=UPI0035B5CDE0
MIPIRSLCVGINFSLCLCIFVFIRPAAFGAEYNGTLELVQLMYRHGDRAPIELYPNDPHQDPSIWPDGLAQLTKKGKAMQYALGKWLRNRYDGFVSRQWKPEEIYVRSTDVDRTLMSAACNLAAFYFPDNPDRFNGKVAWMPTPIHTAPLSNDILLSVDESCPRIQEELELQENLPIVKNVTDDSQKLFEFLSEKSGSNITSILDVDYLYDTLRIEALYNLTLPDWTNDVMEHMKLLSDFSFEIVALSEELKRLRAGPIMKELGSHMREKADGKLEKEKMFVYSAHDTTLATLMLGLGVFNNIAPPYASTVLIELHKIDGDHYVQMYFRNDTKIVDPPYELTLPGCETKCPLDKWIEITSAVIPEDWVEECKKHDIPYDFHINAATIAVLTVALIFASLFLGLCIYNVIQWRQRTNFKYQSIPTHSP